MMSQAQVYIALIVLGMAFVSTRTGVTQDHVHLLYSFEITTDGKNVGYAGPNTETTRLIYQKDDFRSTSLPLPAELATDLDFFEQGPDSPIIKTIFVIRGSAKVWECGFNAIGEWECKKVSH